MLEKISWNEFVRRFMWLKEHDPDAKVAGSTRGKLPVSAEQAAIDYHTKKDKEAWEHDRVMAEALARLRCTQDTVALVEFQNVDMWSSQMGSNTALAVGPNHTYESVQAVEGHHLHDLPSQRQYPQCYTEDMPTEDK